ncbi:MAG: STAS domain-containing protein [Ruminococcus sp.]|nr:STAS domain-containing protein [Ruminococcus sp.]
MLSGLREKNLKIKELNIKDLPRDIFTGIIIALVSIPISMGYAQVSGLPAVYGLYGSIFPILIFGLLSTSRQFIFGVDAAPAALVGAFLATAGIESGSAEAVRTVPVVSFFVGMWLLLMYVVKAGRLVTYISTPVMGGFISGISTTIIFMQIPKILGGTSGHGEIAELIAHIVHTFGESFNYMSAITGVGALAVLLISKKLAPKLPMSVFVMIGGAILGYTGFADRYGIAKLDRINCGLPQWHFPDIHALDLSDVLSTSLTVAIVIMAETLLASSNLANKNGYKLDNNREILVYGLGNLAASFTGCCPVNGSVSRSAMGEQYGGKSQVMSLTASVTMIVILLFAAGFIQYLPVPVLTAIVISALMGAVEVHLAKRLFRHDKRELFIFCGAFFGVLIFGTVYGVMIGVVLSFISVIINTANPKRSFLGIIDGHEGFHSLERNTYASPVRGAVIYRFSGNLYFANIEMLVDDIGKAVKDDTKCVIVDSGAVCNMDITAADRVESLYRSLERQGVKLYFASHIGSLNDRFRELGIGYMVEEGRCRRTIPAALLDAGIAPPYETENGGSAERTVPAERFSRLEFEWAFGSMADEEMERYAEKLMENIHSGEDSGQQLSHIVHADTLWKGIGDTDQEELLEHLQAHLRELAEKLGISEERIEEAIELRKLKLASRIGERSHEAFEVIRRHSERFENSLKESDPKVYESLLRYRREALDHLRKTNPEYASVMDELYNS